MSFRKEKKYRIGLSDLFIIKKQLLSEGMRELYPSRLINSFYFDTDDMLMFAASEEGSLPRRKVRVRWYNNSKRFFKELKVSSIEGRYKTSEELLSETTIADVLNLRFFDQQYGKLRPSLQVTYERSYFWSQGLRLTFDINIAYRNLRSQLSVIKRDNECVMEIKVPFDCNDDYVEKFFSYPSSRFSKYARGLIMHNQIM